MAIRVALRGIVKRFGDLVANDAVDLELRAGEIHALLGENGAGKSTLMNVLSGVTAPDGGEIAVDGDPLPFASPREALAHGIGMVHQHFQLFEGLTVAENLHVGWDATPAAYGGATALARRAREAVDRLGMAIDVDAEVWRLSVGEKQRVEILRALVRGARVLILDEPTAVLTPKEVESLFELVRRMRAEGSTVVFISHKLPEVLAIADRITVMRRGRVVAALDREGTDARILARHMFGAEIEPLSREPAPLGDEIVRLDRVAVRDDRGLVALHDATFAVRAGEVVGVAGVAGNGQRELSEVLSGMRRATTGTVTVAGRDLTRARPRDFVRAGVGCVPEDRYGTGLARTESIWCNAILKCYRERPVGRGVLVRRRAAERHAERLIEAVKLSASDVSLPVRALSGGHAQRLLAGREMDVASRVLVLTYPTRGLDIQAVLALRQSILAARAKGIATVVISEELDEIRELADRVLVLYEGRLVADAPVEGADWDEVGRLMSGIGIETEDSHAPA
ncbi:MAG: ABC transporter ATP-binding protein [Thermoleophilaceae bacterium]